MDLRGKYFNPRPREEGDTKFIIKLYTILNFNPRPREEGDVQSLQEELSEDISIHALVKRATLYHNLSFSNACISIHALVKRATQGQRVRQLRRSYFNPRPREEGDLYDNGGLCTACLISIHALVKRATISYNANGSFSLISIHALVKRATRN